MCVLRREDDLTPAVIVVHEGQAKSLSLSKNAD